jgi:hypothetical protein
MSQAAPQSKSIIHTFVMPSLLALGMLGMLFEGAYFTGVLPATPPEREFIRMIEASVLAKEPVIAASIDVTRDSLYVAREDFLLVESAFDTSVRAEVAAIRDSQTHKEIKQ